MEDLTSYKEAIKSESLSKWLVTMEDELKSIGSNDVWDLVERFKARLVAKGYTQREDIDYKQTFSPVSTKDSFRIIMALVAHYDLELHQMDVKTTFLNGDLKEDVYMAQPEGFVVEGKEHLACRL